MRLKAKIIAVFAGVLLVGACDGSDNVRTGIASFGDAFVAMFSADRNAEPVDAQTIDIAVDLTAEPFNP